MVTIALSIDPGVGGKDTIRAGKGNAVIFGGADDDDIANGDGNSTLFGDNGRAEFTDGLIKRAFSIAPTIGGKDKIVAGKGNNVVFGGADGDELKVGDALSSAIGSVLFGDNGYAEFVNGAVKTAYTINPTIGGADTIVTGDGDHLSIGGADGDSITRRGQRHRVRRQRQGRVHQRQRRDEPDACHRHRPNSQRRPTPSAPMAATTSSSAAPARTRSMVGRTTTGSSAITRSSISPTRPINW